MRISEIDRYNITEDIVDRVLFKDLEDCGENADCIIVLGSIKAYQYRIPVAVEAYRKGRASKILLSGGAIRDFAEGRMTEAEHMRMHAANMGVALEDIIVDNLAQNTVENMFCALLVLQRSFWINRVKKVLLVTTSYHMRRSLTLARYYFPKHIEVMPCPADDNNTRRENWMESGESRKRVHEEVNNIINCVENGLIPDFEI